MESCLTCKYCKHSAYVPRSAQHIRCFGCEAVVLSVGTSSDSNDLVHHSRMPPRTSCTNVVHYKRMPQSTQHINCIGCEIDYSVGNTSDHNMTHYRRTKDGGRWKKLPFSREQQSKTGMPSRAISGLMPAKIFKHMKASSLGKWEYNNPPFAPKATIRGKAICFSVCQDYQQAADTSISAFSQEKEMNGVMTIAFINAVKASLARNENITYWGIMDSMHQCMKQAGKSGGFCTGKSRILHRRILQYPQLSSSEEFDTSTEFKL